MKEYIKILVAVVDYPDNNGNIKLMYVHTRNLQYIKDKIKVTVLNFSAKKDYVFEEIPVITLKKFKEEDKEYDILVCHAPNLRNHYIFLKKYGDLFPKFVFFFHGHEVLKTNQTYSKPYPFVRNSKIKVWLQDCYDDFKLAIWHKYYPSVKNKSKFVFVSRWMLEEFLKWTRVSIKEIDDNVFITYNGIGKQFEDTKYDVNMEKKYDFITVRGNLDGSKYSVDIVNELAKSHPNIKFLLVGKGEFFNHYEKAPNLIWKNQTMNHAEIIEALQASKCALMPTRTDAQGLMMCEMASIGIPLITSDLPVCHEVFDEFKNVAYISNEMNQLHNLKLDEILNKLERAMPYESNSKYYICNTSEREKEMLLALAKR